MNAGCGQVFGICCRSHVVLSARSFITNFRYCGLWCNLDSHTVKRTERFTNRFNRMHYHCAYISNRLSLADCRKKGFECSTPFNEETKPNEENDTPRLCLPPVQTYTDISTRFSARYCCDRSKQLIARLNGSSSYDAGGMMIPAYYRCRWLAKAGERAAEVTEK